MEEKEKIRILLVDDDEEDYLITREIISDIKNQQYSMEWVSNYEKALDEIEKDIYDLFLFDYDLGTKTGLDLIGELTKKMKNIPVIMLTGQNNREIDLIAMGKGASDYLVKGRFDADLLERSIRYAIEKKKTESQILYLAYYDQVTDLPNRIFFNEQLNYSLAHAIRYNRILAVMYLDLDNFKLINDSMGHHVGDSILKEVAKRLSSCLRKSDIVARNNLKTPIDTVARLGGDEFTISLTEITTYEDASIVSNRILQMFNEPFIIDDNKIFTGVSIGIAMHPSDADDAETLLKYADNAMYHAKKQGKNNFQYYQKSMSDNVMAKVNMINDIRTGIEKNEFMLYYQPKMDMKSGKITGFEALIRWNKAGKGIIPPMEFIPFAEEHNLISLITDWVIKDVCRQFCEWASSKLSCIPVSINLPISLFKKPDLTQYLRDIIESHHLSPELFELELTESIFADDMQATSMKLNELKAMGIQISIDDFGTGFSSLSWLKQLPCDILKIDKSFIKSIDEKSTDAIIVNSIITMGQGLNMKVLAEGVETASQYNFLKNSNLDIIQGYLLSPPVPNEKIPDILKNEDDGNGIGIQLIKKISEGVIDAVK
jgi:diguanylate cyclase (GGDEF)-like protein